MALTYNSRECIHHGTRLQQPRVHPPRHPSTAAEGASTMAPIYSSRECIQHGSHLQQPKMHPPRHPSTAAGGASTMAPIYNSRGCIQHGPPLQQPRMHPPWHPSTADARGSTTAPIFIMKPIYKAENASTTERRIFVLEQTSEEMGFSRSGGFIMSKSRRRGIPPLQPRDTLVCERRNVDAHLCGDGCMELTSCLLCRKKIHDMTSSDVMCGASTCGLGIWFWTDGRAC